MKANHNKPLLRVCNLSHYFGSIPACLNITFDLYSGEVLGIVGESGSGKTTLLNCVSAQLPPSAGDVYYRTRDQGEVHLYKISESTRRMLLRTDWGIVYQNPRDGLRLRVSAGGNVGEPLMAVGARNHGMIRNEVLSWMERVELDKCRIDDPPYT